MDYHFILTLQTNHNGQVLLTYIDGVFNSVATPNRSEALRRLKAHAVELKGEIWADAAVMFFSLEPEDLP